MTTCNNIHASIQHRTKKHNCLPLIYFSQLWLQALQLFHAETMLTDCRPAKNTIHPRNLSKQTSTISSA